MAQDDSLNSLLRDRREIEDKRKRENQKSIVAYLSRGSTLLQQGNFRSREDIDKLRTEVMNYNFDKDE